MRIVLFFCAIVMPLTSFSQAYLTDKEYKPTGNNLVAVDFNCDPHHLEDELAKAKTGLQFELRLDEYTQKCERNLRAEIKKGFLALVKFSKTKYDISQNRLAKTIKWKLPSGLIVNGILALKPGAAPRPLIVYKCGVFCSGEDTDISVVSGMMNFFDETPYNLLITMNSSGRSYIQNNHKTTMPNEEVQEVEELAQWLRQKSEIKDQISSLHLSGVSLAALTVALASIKENKSESSKAYNSYLAMCPMLDMAKTTRELANQSFSLEAMVVHKWTVEKYIKSLFEFATDIAGAIDLSAPPKQSETPDYTENLAVLGLNNRNIKMSQPEYQNLHNFHLASRGQRLDQNLLVIGSEDDGFLSQKLNTEILKVSEFHRDNSNHLSSNLIPFGQHCGTNGVYGNKLMSSIIRGHISRTIASVSDANQKKEIPFEFTNKELNSDNLVHVSQVFNLNAKSELVELTFTVLIPTRGCKNADPFAASANCYKTIVEKVPFSLLGGTEFGIANTQAEAEAWTRQLNSRYEVKGDQAGITGTAQSPNGFMARW